MTRIAVLLLACAALVHGKEADKCDAKVASLEKALKAAKQENEKLQKSANDMRQKLDKAFIPRSEVPYFSAEVLTHSVGALRHLVSLAAERSKATVPIPEWASAEKLVGPTQAVANASLAAFQKAREHAGTAAIMALETGKRSASSATTVAQELYGKHAAPYAETYVTEGAKLYEAHVAPAVASGRKLYTEKVHPHLGRHVGLAHEKLTVAAGAAYEHGKTLAPVVKEYAEVARLNAQAWLNSLQGPIFDKMWAVLEKITEPRSFSIAGRKFSFPWGFVDICLLAIQVFIFGFLGLVITWKLFLKTLLWKIGLKFLGRKMIIGVTYSVIKVSYRTTRLLASITVFLVRKTLRLAYLAVLLSFFCGLGLLTSLSASRGLAIASPGVAIDQGVLLIAGLCLGLLLFLCTWCSCCCCRKRRAKDKAPPSTAKKAERKTQPANEKPSKQEQKVTKADAKQAPQAAKNGKKR